MTATLTTAPRTTGPATTARPAGRAGSTVQGHLPRPVRRVPLEVVPPAAVPAVDYGRRRLAAGLLVGLLLVALALSVRAGVAWLGADAVAGSTSPPRLVLVAEPGDSYWQLAQRVHAGGDIRSTVDALRQANGGRELRAGDRIVLAG